MKHVLHASKTTHPATNHIHVIDCLTRYGVVLRNRITRLYLIFRARLGDLNGVFGVSFPLQHRIQDNSDKLCVPYLGI